MFLEALNELKKNSPNKEFLAIILGSDQGRKIYKKKIVINFFWLNYLKALQTIQF